MNNDNNNNDLLINEIIKIINNKEIPHNYIKKWITDSRQTPHNFVTGSRIKGSNALKLVFLDKSSTKQFATFNQIKFLNGTVKKGEKGILLNWVYPLDEKEILKRKMKLTQFQKETLAQTGFVFFRANIAYFNIEQTTLTDEQVIEHQKKNNFPRSYYTDENEDKKIKDFKDNKTLESIIKKSNIPIINNIKSSRAFYNFTEDSITMPNKEKFLDESSYYTTILHELGHSTAHEKRLDRPLSGNMQSTKYAREELVAELFSCIKSIELGVPIELHSSSTYLENWFKMIDRFSSNTELKTELREALTQAEKASKYVSENWYPQELKEKQNFSIKEKQQINEIENTNTRARR